MISNLGSGAAMLAALSKAIEREIQLGIEQAARMVETEMKGELGTQQGQVAHLPAWAPVKSNPDSPLLLTGDLRNSISTVVGDKEAFIGTPDEKAVHLEYGTKDFAPHSFVERAMVVTEPKIKDMMTKRIIRTSRKIG
jgi:phage gpG-like protein